MAQQRTMLLPSPKNPKPIADFWANPIKFLSELHAECGPTAAFDDTEQGILSTLDSALIDELFNSPDRFVMRVSPVAPRPDTAAFRILHAFTHQEHDTHRNHRAPAAHYLRRETFRHSIAQLTEIIDRYFDRWEYGQIIDPMVEGKRLTSRLSIGSFLGNLSEEDLAYNREITGRWMQKIGDSTIEVTDTPIEGTSYYELNQISEQIEQFYLDKINEEREKPGTHPLLGVMLNPHFAHHYSDTELASNLNTIIASTETLSTHYAWVLLMLSQYPEWSQAILDEIKQIVPNGSYTLEQLDQHQTLSHVLKETNRMFPPAAILTRKALNYTTLGNYNVNKDSSVFVCTHLLHRDPKSFDNPNQFNPNRWHTAVPSPYLHMPFGLGAHLCVAMRWAQAVTQLFFIRFYQRFSFRLADTGECAWGFHITGNPTNFKIELLPPDHPFEKQPIRGPISTMI